MRISILTTLLIFLASFDLHATVLGGVAMDATDDSPLPACAVALLPVGQSVQTDIDGRFAFKVKPGEYIIKASYVGFDDYETIIKIGKRDTSVVLRLQPKSEQLRDVVITAKESTGVTSSSRIDKDAMTHLQPSSFSDLLELLPGNISQNPEMGTVNSIKLRETGNIGATGTLADNADYAMSALGTAFNVDGAPVNNDANLQSVGIESATGRNAVNRGVDMRSLSTDNIESVEIVRGIPSAEYGNLSSGLVNIRRIRRATPLSARFKADGYSKLFYVGKGIAVGPQRRNTLNADLGWLDSKTDPRNKLENYKRITASVRTALNWQNQYTLREWNLAADYTGTVDKAKTDPDLSLNKIDEYQANNHRVALTSDFSVSFLRIPALKRLDFKASASYQNDRLKRRRQVSPGLGAVAPITNTEGVHDGIYILEEYIADYLSEGKPLSLFAKLGLTGAIPSWSGSNQTYKAGVEWNMSKNYGRGQVYDPHKPLSGSWTSRPRAFKDIPALNVVSAYAEDAITYETGVGGFDLQAGVHAVALAGLDKKYDIAGKLFLDPRINAVWRFPSVNVRGRNLDLLLAGGYGLNTRMPTVDYLYPQQAFLDLLQLNYYDTKDPKNHSRVNLRTYINDATNYQLQPARNHKWEVRAGASVGANHLSVTYFEEHMGDGFRYANVYDSYKYTKYDPSGIVSGDLQGPPDIDKLPSTDERVLRGYRRAENGSRIDKRGVEFQITTARWKPLATSLIINGAWMRSRYSNSQMMFDPVNTVIGGVAVSDKYVGLYDTNDGRVNEQFNTNFMFDTQIPRLGLVFSTTFQCMWYVKTRRLKENGIPVKYISSVDGLLHDFENGSADPLLQQLIQSYSPRLFDTYKIPAALYVNLKATKTIGKWLRVAVFVNRILDYLPDYKSNGLTVRRSSEAYFGMELNFSL